jgi:hypothetical protein
MWILNAAYNKVQWFLFEMTAWTFAQLSGHFANTICMCASTYVKYGRTFSRREYSSNIQMNGKKKFKYTFNSTTVICRFPVFGTRDEYSLNEIMDDMDKDEMDFEEEIQKFALRDHPRIHQLSKEYLSKLDESMDSMYRCPGCKVRYFKRKPRDSEGDCKLCQLFIKKHGIRITSAENDMDPFPYLGRSQTN